MKAQTEITRLQDAKALKEIGAPCNTPVAHHKFKVKLDRYWDSLVGAQLRFLSAVFRYAAEGQNASVRRRRQVENRLDDITNAIRRCDTFVVGDANRSDQDEHEKGILALFLIQRAVPFVEFWQETIEVIANGTSSEIKWRDIPVWFDEIMSKPG
jgi:hypothetical protein